MITLLICLFALAFPAASMYAQAPNSDLPREVRLTDKTIDQYFLYLEKKAEAMVRSAQESEYNEVFERYFKKYYKADTCRYIALPDRVEVYKYDMDMVEYMDTHIIGPEVQYQLIATFVPFVDVGKEIIYYDDSVLKSLRQYEENLNGHKLRLLQKYINVSRYNWKAPWNYYTYPLIPEIIIGKNGICVYAQLSDVIEEETLEDFEGNIIYTNTTEPLLGP